MSSARRTLTRIGAVTGTAGLLTLGLAGVASAHVSVTPSDTGAGAYTILTFSVPHGCDGSATTGIKISIPEGINSVTPTRNDYYEVTKQAEKLTPPITDAHGNELTERVSTVTYAATTPLPDGFRDTFELSLQIPEDAEGSTLTFPVIQTCEKGETAWTQVPTAGQTEDDLDDPAPAFEVTAAGEGGHGEAAEDGTEGTDDAAAVSAETAPASASTDGAAPADDDGNGLAIAGLVAGIGGLVVGGAALARSRRTA